MWRWVRRLLLGLIGVSAALMFLTWATPQGRAAVRTVLFIPQVLPAIPVKPQEWVTPDPVWLEVSFPQAHGEGVAVLVLPAGSGKHSAVLFFMGVVTNTPRDDPRIVNLAEGLARSGMVVMLPWMETQRQQHIVTEDLDNLVSAFQYLVTLDPVDPDRAGMGGICTGASMATVAAQDERIRDDVAFVNFFAGYYDAFDFARAVGSRSRFDEGGASPWDPDKLTQQVMRYHLLDGVANEDDKTNLVRWFYEGQKPTEAELRALSAEGDAVYRLINGVPFDQVDGLMELLSPKTKEFLRKVSPSTNIDNLKARILIMHDTADLLVPSEESRRFRAALANHPDTYFTEFSLFQAQVQVHVDEESKGVGPLGFVKEASKLFMHMYNIMRDVS